LAGINPPSKFKDITEIAYEAVKMDDIDAMVQFVKEENDKLDCPVPEDDLVRLLNEISTNILAAQNEFNYSQCVEELSQIKPKVELKERVLQAIDFVNSIVLSKDGNVQEMELFIECEVFDYFAIPKGKNHQMNKIFRSGYAGTIKAKKKELSNKQKAESKAGACTFDIDSEFNGLYQVSESETGNITIKPFYDMIAKYVSDKLHVISFRGNLFIYKEGCYKIDPYTVKAEATRVLNGIMKNENSRDISKRLTDVMTYIQNYNVVNEYPFNNYNNAFPVRNGVVVFDFENGTHWLEENPDPDTWKFDYVLDVDYYAEADSNNIMTRIAKYLYDNPEQPLDVDEANGRYDSKIILQIPAQGILQAMGYGPYKSVYLLVGEPNSGKTTIIDFISYFVGDSCKCTIGLDEFTSGDRFVMARKEGKILNLHDDLGYFKMGDTGRVKAMSGGYNHKIERKGKDGYDGRITTVDVYTANRPAGFNRNIYIDKAFWGRWYYVYFPNHFDQNDEFQKNTFTEENKSAFLNEVIKMIVEIRQGKRLVVQKEEWTEVRRKWMQAGNILYRFIEDNMVAGGRTSFIKDELFTALKAWCIDNKQGEDLLPQRSFDLGDMVELCGGIGDTQRVFKNKGLTSHHCFVLNYSWKPQSKYKKYCPSEAATDQDIITSYC
jgi:putative DNA primase/helicase